MIIMSFPPVLHYVPDTASSTLHELRRLIYSERDGET